MHKTVTILDKAQNINIRETSIVVNADNSKGHNLDRLFSEVAQNAILNADGRADEVRCYPGTREEVIGKAEIWMNGEGNRMMWLSGPAGAGKSAICQTLAERCRERGQPQANFFFFRGDGTRNTAQHLVATLVYQLRCLYPALDVPLSERLIADPLICTASLEDQFAQLISSPIQTLHRSSPIERPIVLIIDGLDECDNEKKQGQILVALRTLADADHSPFLILVANRAEPHLVMSFNRIGNLAESIFLNDEYRPQEDILLFVIAKFDEIKTLHSLAHTLSTDWPSVADILSIIKKSSGQFIYAATVIRFIEGSSGSPALSLRTILGVRPAVGHSPYAQLDATYSYIFSKAQDIRTVKLILGAHLICAGWVLPKTAFADLLHLVGYESIEVESLFADLAAIVRVSTDPATRLVFYHASLVDYLQDESRSASYHVNKAEIATELSLICLQKFHDSSTLYLTIVALSGVRQATESLSKSLLNASARKLDKSLQSQKAWMSLTATFQGLYSEKDYTMFKTMLLHCVRFGYRNGITNLSEGSEPFILDTYATIYYRWYCTTEQVRFALRLSW